MEACVFIPHCKFNVYAWECSSFDIRQMLKFISLQELLGMYLIKDERGKIGFCCSVLFIVHCEFVFHEVLFPK